MELTYTNDIMQVIICGVAKQIQISMVSLFASEKDERVREIILVQHE